MIILPEEKIISARGKKISANFIVQLTLLSSENHLEFSELHMTIRSKVCLLFCPKFFSKVLSHELFSY